MLPNFLKHTKMEAALWVASIFFFDPKPSSRRERKDTAAPLVVLW